MKKAVLATFFAFASGAAHASTILFTGGSDNLTEINIPTDGINLSVSAFGTDYDGLTGAGTVQAINRNPNGWGVQGGEESGRIAGGEALVLDFGNSVVDLNSARIFERGPQAENFDLFVDGVLAGSFTLPADNGSNFVPFSFGPSGLQGSTFAFVGTNPGGSGNRGIRIREIDFTVVPLPAGFPLLLGGIAAFWAVRRKQS